MNKTILHLRSSGGFYGAEQVILNLARELETLGCTNHIACLNNTYSPHLELVERARKANLSAFAVDCRRRFDRQTVTSIRKIIGSKDVDVVHCHDYKTRLFGLCAAKELTVQKVATNHLWPRVGLKGLLYETLDGMLLNGFDKVVAVSELIERECRPFLLRKSKLIFIPNGIDPRPFALENREEARIATRAQLGFKETDLLIGNIARLSSEKDHVTLLRAFKLLTVLSREKSYKLLLVGDGPQEQKLRKLAQDLGIHKRCLFAGVRSDIPQLLNSLDVYVQSSRREGLPMIVLEAMASEVAIVSTKAGGVPKVIADGEQGRLVEIGDVDQLARVLHDVLSNASERKKLGQQARHLVEAKFTAHAMAERYLGIYREITENQ